jgi:hypothetical protein
MKGTGRRPWQQGEPMEMTLIHQHIHIHNLSILVLLIHGFPTSPQKELNKLRQNKTWNSHGTWKLPICRKMLGEVNCHVGIEDLHVTSSMTLRTVAAMLEVFFCAAQDVLMEITLENDRK